MRLKLYRKGGVMLVLTRKCGESIRIGNDTEVTVLMVRGKYVRLGFRAPRSVAIQRVECSTARRSPPFPPVQQPTTRR